MNDKKVKRNIVLYVLKQISAILFPMVLYPYVTRKLGVESLGVVEYTKSITQYFILFSGLGISDYAIREGARIRDDKEKISKFATQVLAINILSTILSYILCLVLTFTSSFYAYQKLIFIFSIMIPFGTLGMNWLFCVFEEYEYISIRTIAFQFVSAILTFILVRSNQDYYAYAIILVVASVGANILNIAKLKKYFTLNFKHFELSIHIKPILLIFGMTLASSLYMTMDTSMLGYLSGTKSVGYYSAANKLVIVIGTLIAAVRTVLLPRLSHMIGTGDKKQFKKLNGLTLNILLFFAVPIACGVFLLSEEIIILFCGKEFVQGARTLRLLVPEILLSAINGYIIYQIFMPLQKEKFAFICISSGAGVNLITNYILIPLLNQDGAAIATVISESMVFLIALTGGRRIIKESIEANELRLEITKCIIASVIMYMGCKRISSLVLDSFVRTLIVIVSGGGIYFILLILLKENIIVQLLRKFTSK